MIESQILSNITIALILLFVTSACNNTKNETENTAPSHLITTLSVNQEESSLVGVWEAIPDTSFIDDLRKEYPEAKEEELLRLRETMTSIETKQKLSFQEDSYCEWTGLMFGGKGNYFVNELSDTVVMMLKCKNRNGKLSTENIAYRINSDNTITKIDYVYGDTIITHFQNVV